MRIQIQTKTTQLWYHGTIVPREQSLWHFSLYIDREKIIVFWDTIYVDVKLLRIVKFERKLKICLCKKILFSVCELGWTALLFRATFK